MYPHLTRKNDRYLAEILEAHANNPANFDAVEVEGCRVFPAPSKDEVDFIEQCEHDDEAHFWSVFLHLAPTSPAQGGLECIGDFVTRAEAETYAREVATQYGYAQRF